ncbi:MAG: PAS domain S-box protein [SAR324 cluster bacterium]|nr:PAS domain S-box protein [SAR324 cluster bacterium]
MNAKQLFSNQGRLSRNLLFWVVTISSFFALLTTVFQLYFSFTEDKANLINSLEFIQKSYVQPIAASTFDIDEKQVRIILQGIQENTNIILLEVWDSNSKWISMEISDAKKDIVMEFPLEHADREGIVHKFGKLVVAASLVNVYQRLWQNAFVLFSSNILKTLLASLFIFLLFEIKITRHLSHIARYFQQLDLNNLKDELILNKETLNPDELDELAEAINTMRNRVNRSIAEREYAEKMLQASEERFRSFAEQTIMGIYVTQKNRIVYANQAFANMVKYSIDDMKAWPAGEFHYKLFHPEDRERAIQQSIKKQRGETEGVLPRLEWRAMDNSRNWFWVESYALTISYQEENANLVYVTDITERKNTEDKIKNINQKLEERVKERTDKLLVQEKLASLGSMTAGISHELKNPLNLVNNFAEQCAVLTEDLRTALNNDNEDKEKIEKLLSMIERTALQVNKHGKRADDIIRAMLLHSRGQKGDWQLININVLLREYTNLAFHSMRAMDPTFNVSLEYDLSESIHKIKVVPENISRVFLNLLNNALYAAREKSKEHSKGSVPTVKIQTQHVRDSVEIRIWDNGNGIPEANRHKIFEPFFTTKPTGSGTGLGLSLSYEIIVQEHQGTLSVESKENEYTEFLLVLPNKQENHREHYNTVTS